MWEHRGEDDIEFRNDPWQRPVGFVEVTG